MLATADAFLRLEKFKGRSFHLEERVSKVRILEWRSSKERVQRTTLRSFKRYGPRVFDQSSCLEMLSSLQLTERVANCCEFRGLGIAIYGSGLLLLRLTKRTYVRIY